MKKQKLCACLFAFSLCAGLSPSYEAEAAKADVKLAKASVKLTISKKGGKIAYGTAKIKGKAVKKGVKVKKVTYKSQNSKIAKVDKKGKVKAKKAGSTKIKVTVKYKKKKKNLKKTLTYKVTVKKSGSGKTTTPTGNAGATSTPGADAQATPTPEQAEAQKKWTALIEQGVIKMDSAGCITECDKEYEGELVIPKFDPVYKYNVANIKGCAFAGCTKLTSVTLPSGINFVAYTSGDIPKMIPLNRFPGVFNGCTSLTSVTLPENMREIPAQMFTGCSSLKTIKLPNGIESIYQSAFYGCSNLTSITIPNSVTSIGDYAFYNVPLVIYDGNAYGCPWNAKKVQRSDGTVIYPSES